VGWKARLRVIFLFLDNEQDHKKMTEPAGPSLAGGWQACLPMAGLIFAVRSGLMMACSEDLRTSRAMSADI